MASDTVTSSRNDRSIGHSPRSEAKLECISAAAARPSARAAGSAGHSRAAGCFSARYSQMAIDSQIARSPSLSTGTRPFGEPAARASALVCSVRSRISVSVNGAPLRFSTSHGRIDQVDQSLSPISSSIVASPCPDAPRG